MNSLDLLKSLVANGSADKNEIVKALGWMVDAKGATSETAADTLVAHCVDNLNKALDTARNGISGYAIKDKTDKGEVVAFYLRHQFANDVAEWI
jgi:hypothetical protein